VRQKKLEYDGAVFVISPLTIEQVERFISPLPEEGDPLRQGMVRAYDLICWGLNNALRSDPASVGEKQWTHERIRQELDPWVLTKLQQEILAFSGLKKIEPGEAPTPEGSSKASDTSGAASLQ
jgi:hypothetical protein